MIEVTSEDETLLWKMHMLAYISITRLDMSLVFLAIEGLIAFTSTVAMRCQHNYRKHKVYNSTVNKIVHVLCLCDWNDCLGWTISQWLKQNIPDKSTSIVSGPTFKRFVVILLKHFRQFLSLAEKCLHTWSIVLPVNVVQSSGNFFDDDCQVLYERRRLQEMQRSAVRTFCTEKKSAYKCSHQIIQKKSWHHHHAQDKWYEKACISRTTEQQFFGIEEVSPCWQSSWWYLSFFINVCHDWYQRSSLRWLRCLRSLNYDYSQWCNKYCKKYRGFHVERQTNVMNTEEGE